MTGRDEFRVIDDAGDGHPCIVHTVAATAPTVVAQRDAWVRRFNRLDVAITHHKNATDGCRDTHDEALYAARDRVLRDAIAAKPISDTATEQRRAALEKGNAVRLARSEFRAMLDGNPRAAAELLRNPIPNWATGWRLSVFIGHLPRFGPDSTLRFWRHLDLRRPDVTIGALTDRQRDLLAGMLDRHADIRGWPPLTPTDGTNL
jgi:hypothetical protein